jgi:hypothetical protein
MESKLNAETDNTANKPLRLAIVRLMNILPRQGKIAIPSPVFYRFRVSGV